MQGYKRQQIAVSDPDDATEAVRNQIAVRDPSPHRAIRDLESSGNRFDGVVLWEAASAATATTETSESDCFWIHVAWGVSARGHAAAIKRECNCLEGLPIHWS